MTESGGPDGPPHVEAGQPSVSPALEGRDGAAAETHASAEAFQTLANEARIDALVALRSAERAGDEPLSFSQLQRAAGADSSAGFAYHLRQLSGRFVRRTEGGYVLTPAGRRAAEAVVAGTFTDVDGQRAS